MLVSAKGCRNPHCIFVLITSKPTASDESTGKCRQKLGLILMTVYMAVLAELTENLWKHTNEANEMLERDACATSKTLVELFVTIP